MIERGILFNGAMVRALLDGSKTQTRRIMKPQPKQTPADYPGSAGHWWPSNAHQSMVHVEQELQNQHGGWSGLAADCCPYGRVGDHLWVRETFGYVSPDEFERPHAECNIEYRADLAPGCTDRPGQWPVDECAADPARPRWRPSIHMPRWASRILLEIVSVRVERLQDISEGDAHAEGCLQPACGPDYTLYKRWAYRNLWNEINGASSWDANPFVWVVGFKRVAP